MVVLLLKSSIDHLDLFFYRIVNIEKMKDGTAYRYVFCVITEDNDISYDLQLAHTTNIPFDYKIHKAKKLDSKDETIENSSASNYTVYTNAKVFQLNN